MLFPLVKRKEPLLGFALTAIVIAVLVIIFSVYDYRRVRARMRDALVDQGLMAVKTFQAFTLSGMSGRAPLNRERLIAIMRDICSFTAVNYFSFVFPNDWGITVSSDYEEPFSGIADIQQYQVLKPQEFKTVYADPECHELLLITPLVLDDNPYIGRKSARFYKTLTEKRHGSNMRSYKAGAPRLPVVIVCLSSRSIVELKYRIVLQSSLIGIAFFLLVSALIYVSIVRQQQRVISHALNEVRADNERLLKNLRFSDRLAILGRMAAAMAHELRNPLGSIRGFIQLFKKNSIKEHDQQMCRYADTVIGEIDRLNSVITSMLNFSRPVEPQLEETELHPFFSNVLRLIKQDATAKGIALISHVPDDLPVVSLDRNLFTQALLNLLINALEAMPGGGELTIEAHKKNSDTISIRIVDSGKGIPKEIQKQIFEPFFTTKPSGTGLGLATVEKVVTEHGGSIRVESIENEGSTFYIELPI